MCYFFILAQKNYKKFLFRFIINSYNPTKDRAGKRFFANPNHFSELVNISRLSDKIKTDPNCLSSQDPVVNKVLGKHKTLEVLIDKLYTASFHDDRISSYCLLGLENQAAFDKHMIIRVGLASLLLYDWQLSSLKKGEKLKLNYIIVLNMSDDKWKGPYSLREFISDKDLEYFGFLQTNVELIVVDPHTLDSSVINSLQTDLKYVLNTIKFKTDGKKLLDYINSEEHFKNLDEVTSQLIKALVDVKLPNDGGNDMCRAMEQIKKSSFDEGFSLGEAKTFYELTKEGLISIDIAAKKLNVTVEKFENDMKVFFDKQQEFNDIK